MAILVQDTFSASGVNLEDHTPDIGPDWLKVSGSSSLVKSSAFLQLLSGSFYINNIPDTANIHTESDFFTPVNCIFILRYTDTNNYYFFETGVGLRKKVLGVVSTLDVYTDIVGAEVTVKVEIIGTDFKLYIDAVEVASATDSDLTTGKTGLLGLPGGTDFDSFEAVGAAVPVPADPTALTATCSVDNPPTSDWTVDVDTSSFVKIEGLVNVINGNASVTGFGTKFTEDLIVGDLIVLNGVVYEIDTITDDTHLTLTTTYDGTSQERIPAWKTEELTFTNTVTGDANSYFWDFGDGTFSTQANPTHIYTEPGLFEVKLVAFALPELTGTVSVISQDTALTGVGTSFTTELSIGDFIIINNVTYEIQSITDNLNAVLTEVYFGTTESGITALHETSKTTGTMDVVQNSTTINGTATTFLTDYAIGDIMVIKGVSYVIDTITSDTVMDLVNPYLGTNDTGIDGFKKQSKYAGEYGNSTFTKTIAIEESGDISVDTIKGDFQISISIPVELTGTVSVVNGSPTVEGVGTLFTTELQAGEQVLIDGVIYTIQSITDIDTFVLTENYAGSNDSGLTIQRITEKQTGTINVAQKSKVVTGTSTSFLTDFIIGDSIVIEGVSYQIDSITSDTELILFTEYNENTGFELTGTISVVNGDATIEGVGTSFTTELQAGEQMLIEGVLYTILSITDNDTLELTIDYAGANDSGLTTYRDTVKLTGTINVTQNSTILNGVGTSFLTDFARGDVIVIEGITYQIDTVTDNTTMILSTEYTGITDTGLDTFRKESVASLDVFKKDSSYSDTGVGPVLIDFVDNSIGTITEYSWDFGDGALVAKTGTLSVTQGSKTVTGSGTLFTSELVAGERIDIDGVLYTIDTIESNTSLTLLDYYAGVDQSGLNFNLKSIGTTSTDANPDFIYTDPGLYTIVLEVVKDNVVHRIEKTIQVKTDSTTPEIVISNFDTAQGTGSSKLSGTLGATQGSKTITGSNTSFTTELENGGEITIQGITYTIDTIISDTELTITQDYIGGTSTTVELQGDISVTQNDRIVTGIGSVFTEDLVIGQTINIEGVGYQIESIESDISLTLTYDYIGVTATSLTVTETVGVLEQGLTGFNSFVGSTILTGSLSVTEGSLKVTGSGTAFTTELVNGDSITIESVTYKVLGVVSDIELILSKVYKGITDSGITTLKSAKESPYSEVTQFNNFSSNVFEDLTGTINVTNNDTNVVGIGTSFTTELEAGQTIKISGIDYVVDFITSNTELELTIVYAGSTDTGITGEEQLINTYFWDFGDGTFSTEQSPEHIYNESGSFEATLTVSNDNGSTRFKSNVTNLKIDFFSIDHNNHRVNMFSRKGTLQPQFIRSSGGFGNTKGAFNNPQDLSIIGVGIKRLDGVEV